MQISRACQVCTTGRRSSPLRFRCRGGSSGIIGPNGSMTLRDISQMLPLPPAVLRRFHSVTAFVLNTPALEFVDQQPLAGQRGVGWLVRMVPRAFAELTGHKQQQGRLQGHTATMSRGVATSEAAGVRRESVLGQWEANLLRKFEGKPQWSRLPLQAARDCMPPALAEVLASTRNMDAASVMHDHLLQFAVVKGGAYFEMMGSQRRARKPVCGYWKPNEVKGCFKGTACDFRHDLPAHLM